MDKIENEGIETESAGIEWVAKELISIDESKGQKVAAIFEDLENDPDVQNYYTNIG